MITSNPNNRVICCRATKFSLSFISEIIKSKLAFSYYVWVIDNITSDKKEIL